MKIFKQPTNKLNQKAMILEMQAVQADADIDIHLSLNWNQFPYRDNLLVPDYVTPPDDIDAPWTSPFYVEIKNGDEANRAAFEAVIEAHDPAMTDIEEQHLLQQQEQAKQLVAALMALPDEQLIPIKQRFDNLVMP